MVLERMVAGAELDAPTGVAHELHNLRTSMQARYITFSFFFPGERPLLFMLLLLFDVKNHALCHPSPPPFFSSAINAPSLSFDR